MLSIGTIQCARCDSFARYSASIFAQTFGQICACTEMFLIGIIQTTFINLFGRKIPHKHELMNNSTALSALLTINSKKLQLAFKMLNHIQAPYKR